MRLKNLAARWYCFLHGHDRRVDWSDGAGIVAYACRRCPATWLYDLFEGIR